jgi:hypothetical protein
MSTLELEQEPIAESVTVTDEKLTLELGDGRTLAVPLAWYPRLMYASSAERGNLRLLGDGYAIEWPDLDEHIGVAGLLAVVAAGKARSLSDVGWLPAKSSRHPSLLLS